MRTRSMLRSMVTGALLGAAFLVAVPSASPALAVPAGFTDSLVGSFTAPTAVKVLPGGDLLVLEKGGTFQRVAANGAVSPAGSIATNAECVDWRTRPAQRGARSDVRHHGHDLRLRDTTSPRWLHQHAVEVHDERRRVVPTSEQVLIDNIPWTATNHNGGTVEVGRDGFLYLSVGEGADPARAQSLASLGGKILRITTTGQPAPGNPFLTAAGHGPCARANQAAAVCDEIYALGLRNPFRTAFDPNSTTTRFRINDVGQSAWEEIDDGAAGANYGWPVREGPCAIGQTAGCTPDPNFTAPRTFYPRTVGAFIVGGAFVPNGWWGATYDSGYLFADGATNNMWLMNAAGAVDYNAPFTTQLSVATDLAFGVRNGERALFYVNNGNGQLRKIVGPNAATTAAAGPVYLGGPGGPTAPLPQPPVQSVPGTHAFTAYPAAQRVLDTRNAIGGPTGRLVGGQPRTVTLGVPAGASAALVNFTLDNGVGPEAQCRPPSYLVAWKPGTAKPATSNANVGGCDVAANTAVVQVDGTGSIVVEVFADVHVIVDVLGYYTPAGGAVTAGRFQAVTPTASARQPGRSGARQRLHARQHRQHLGRALPGGRPRRRAGRREDRVADRDGDRSRQRCARLRDGVRGRHAAARDVDGEPHRQLRHPGQPGARPARRRRNGGTLPLPGGQRRGRRRWMGHVVDRRRGHDGTPALHRTDPHRRQPQRHRRPAAPAGRADHVGSRRCAGERDGARPERHDGQPRARLDLRHPEPVGRR